MTRALRTTARVARLAAGCTVALIVGGSLAGCASAGARPRTGVTASDSTSADSTFALADSIGSRRHHGMADFHDPGSSMDQKAINAQKVTRVEELLVGRFPGVNVTRNANGRMSVQIRGQTSLYNNTEPLIVIDGMIIPPGAGGLDSVNPYDIARIDVLRRIDETAWYGVRGANGVIVITTKKR